MRPTTSYGTWTSEVGNLEIGPADRIASYITNGDPGDVQRFHDSGGFDAALADYRSAINNALPADVHLIDNEFIGPAYAEEYADLDIADIVNRIDVEDYVAPHLPEL